ncbi:uncharacterized protein BJ212DRAFT_1479530 [Suillus subaureus]|uniref:Uncharacterized protein n=1 Tax=Suillus subaureus TaxID=48587 RepID=A0A9P7JET9_9AGAM|nr:uncharacterized protein BJ212DRAFT_1479530 [Suillus subaureus]KAG1818521.1 hypothetical protein BJ212DRAFT_1479530 [Suillus subaureus]
MVPQHRPAVTIHAYEVLKTWMDEILMCGQEDPTPAEDVPNIIANAFLDQIMDNLWLTNT